MSEQVHSERDMTHWLKCGTFPMSLPAMRFRIPFGAGCSCFSPLNLGTLFRGCVIGQGTSPSNASLDSCENDYLRQRRQCVRLVQCVEMAAGLYALHGVEMAHE